MNLALLGLICFVVMMLMVMVGVHVSFALIFMGIVGLGCIIGFGTAISSFVIISFERLTDYSFAVAPLFLLMSSVISNTNISREAYDMARSWIGMARGGLAMATVVACGFFAAVCGSSMAGAIAMGKVAYPEMVRHKYDSQLAIGTVAAGATLGILIPPSMGFIIIGILTEVSIGKLFIAGIIPGILEIVFYMVTIYIMCRFNPQLGPAGPKTTVKEKAISLRFTWPVVILFLLIIGGLYGGIFTPTEAGGVGAFGALVISLIRRQITGRKMADCLLDTARITGMMMALIIGAFVFKQFMAMTRIPFVFSDYVVALGVSKWTILIIVLIFYIILGMVFDVYAILAMTVPILFPVMVNIGFNPVWYCVIMVRIVEIGLITPPFGFNLFALSGTVDVPVRTLYRGVFPFLIADILHVGLLLAIPAISTFLPDLMINK